MGDEVTPDGDALRPWDTLNDDEKKLSAKIAAKGPRTARSNENKFFNGYPDELSENLGYLETLCSADTYNHYPTAWAVAFSTPFQMFKRYSRYSGGTCDPMVIHWPKGIKTKGEVRGCLPRLVSRATWIASDVGVFATAGMRSNCG